MHHRRRIPIGLVVPIIDIVAWPVRDLEENHLRKEISLANKWGSKLFVAELEEDAGSSLLTAAVLPEANRNGVTAKGQLGLMMRCELQRLVWSLL